jgi:uncharacterized protein (TIGR02466 family)
MRIDTWFPTPIGIVVNEKNDCTLSNYCMDLMSKIDGGGSNWIGRPYTTAGTKHELLEDSKFSELNSWVENKVNEFVSTCGWENVTSKEGWFNIYKAGDFQEYHVHSNCNFSCVYYLDVQDNDSKIFFSRSPLSPIDNKVVKGNPINNNLSWYTPSKGLLLIFKSDTMHMVEQKKTDDIRISLSYNFSEKN